MDSGTAVIAAAANASTSVILTSGNARVKAVFTLKSFTLTLQKTNAGDTLFPYPSASVQYGVGTSILAKPALGTHFANWTTASGTASFADSTQAGTSVTLTSGDATVRAITALDAYTLTITKDSGSVTVSPAGKTSFAYGDTARLTAAPVAGYRFSGWSG